MSSCITNPDYQKMQFTLISKINEKKKILNVNAQDSLTDIDHLFQILKESW